MASKYSNMTVKAFRRENGRVGVRNHVVILPVDDISNAACEAVANNPYLDPLRHGNVENIASLVTGG